MSNNISNKDVIIKKIKSKGYWEINIRPTSYNANKIPINNLKEILRPNIVELRGWYYPHFKDAISDEPYPISNGIEKCFDGGYHIEFWRFTTSGNFYHLLAIREDWIDNQDKKKVSLLDDVVEYNTYIGVLGVLYTITEIYEFAKRLAYKQIFNESAYIEIKMYNLCNRALKIDEPGRMPFHFPRVAKTSEPWNNNKTIFQVDELINKSDQIAFEAFLDLIRLFQWENPPVDNLKNDQEKFLKGRA